MKTKILSIALLAAILASAACEKKQAADLAPKVPDERVAEPEKPAVNILPLPTASPAEAAQPAATAVPPMAPN